jgi:hypothetical protein
VAAIDHRVSATPAHGILVAVGAEPHQDDHARHSAADSVGFIVYGTIAVLAALGGLELESQALHASEAAAVLVIVALSAWLAHSMWRVVRARGRGDVAVDRSRELHELMRSWPIVASGVPGAAVMLLAAAGAWSVAGGLEIAQGLGIAVLLAAGLVTARLAGVGGPQQLVYVLALPSVGLAIVALEVLAHKI